MPDEPRDNHQQRQQWSAVAEAWDRHYEWCCSVFEPLVEWCTDAIALEPGSRVLDVASGAGIPALSMASRVGPHGLVTAIDLAPDMLRLAAKRARASQLSTVRFGEMDAEALAFPDATFDGVTCTFGLMFCADPVCAVAEMRRVLKPGGRFAIVVWDTPSRNPFISVFGRALSELLALPKPNRQLPGPFRFADPAEFAQLLRDGGLVDFRVESCPLTLIYESVAAYQDSTQALAAGFRTKLEGLSAADSLRLAELVRTGAEPYRVGRALHFPAAPLCAVGRAPLLTVGPSLKD